MFVATNVSASGRNYNNAAPRGFRVHARVDNNSEGFNVSAVRWGGAGTRRGITTGDHNGSMTVTTTRAAARWSRQNDFPILFTRFSAVFRRRRSPIPLANGSYVTVSRSGARGSPSRPSTIHFARSSTIRFVFIRLRFTNFNKTITLRIAKIVSRGSGPYRVICLFTSFRVRRINVIRTVRRKKKKKRYKNWINYRDHRADENQIVFRTFR